MTDIKHISANGKLIFIKPPKGSTGYKIDKDGITFDINYSIGFVHITLPNLEYEPIGLCSEVLKSEELASKVVEEVSSWGKMYWKDYLTPNSFVSGYKSIDSFSSLLQAKEIYLVNPLGDYSIAHKRHLVTGTWKEFEQKVGDWLILKVI